MRLLTKPAFPALAAARREAQAQSHSRLFSAEADAPGRARPPFPSTARLAKRASLAYIERMDKYILVSFGLFFSLFLAGCGAALSGGELHSYAYQEEAPSRVPGHNLYRPDSLDVSAAQRVNQFNRSEIFHERQQSYIQRLTEARELDKAAQKLGREPGSLFRQ